MSQPKWIFFLLVEFTNNRTASHVDGVTPDGYSVGLSGGRFFIDVTIAYPTGATHMRNGSTRHKHFALNHLEDLKIAKFEQRCNEYNSDFVPLALETYVGTSEKFDKLIGKLSSKAADFNNIPYISNFTQLLEEKNLYCSTNDYNILEKFDKLLEKLSSKAAEFNNISYPILLNYWKKRISTVLQIGNVSVISEAYRRLFNFGAETLQRDCDLERTFN